jgi:hypothetical protein
MSKREADVLASLGRLALCAPAASTARAKDVVRALCAGFGMIDDAELSKTITGLTVGARTKYLAAMALGPAELMNVVEEVVDDVIANPSKFPNMCTKGKRRRSDVDANSPTVCVFPGNKEHHPQVRYTIYGALAVRLGYKDSAGERVPLPALVETLVKLSFPGTKDAEFTWFVVNDAATHSDNDAGEIDGS